MLWVWNELLIALVFLQSENSLTLMVGLTGFQNRYNLNIPVVMAGLSLATLPIVALYVFGQRFFMRGPGGRRDQGRLTSQCRLAHDGDRGRGGARAPARGDRMRMTLFPEVGAKILDLVHKPTGDDLLWKNPRVPLRRTYPGPTSTTSGAAAGTSSFPPTRPARSATTRFTITATSGSARGTWYVVQDDGCEVDRLPEPPHRRAAVPDGEVADRAARRHGSGFDTG